MPQHRYLFLDDGGVLNSSALRQPQWKQLVGAFLRPRLGGTIEAWGEANFRTFPAVYLRQQARLENWRPDRVYLAELRLTDIDWLASMCNEMGIAPPRDDECAILSRETQSWIMSQVVAGLPGVADAVRELSGEYVLYTASGGTSFELRMYLRTLGIEESTFRRLYGADLVNWPKLGPEFHRRIFQDAGVDPAECIVVDDQARAIAWAREAGAFTVLVDPGQAVESEAELIVGSLAELPAALKVLG